MWYQILKATWIEPVTIELDCSSTSDGPFPCLWYNIEQN
jgi:hypothetical protein